MSTNPLIDLEHCGQSIWLDFISKELNASGELQKLVKLDHLKGLTSNPAIFEKAIAQTNDYDSAITILGQKDQHNAKLVYENIAITEIQTAADLLRPVYEESKSSDGFVSFEVSPHLSCDSKATVEEAKTLWHQIDRPNLMIKIPGTKEGLVAVRELISEGININITLLFSLDTYRDAAHAYLYGLRDRVIKGLPINTIQSVASFFISRIDTKVDALLETIALDPNKAKLAQSLQGKIAIANAKLAYQLWEEIYHGELAKSLARQGAHPQRLLWASTGVKNPSYRDVVYVESLIAKQTVNTLPPATMAAFRDHGKTSTSIKDGLHEARAHISALHKLGINLDTCCEELLTEGLKLFSDAFDHLLRAVEIKLNTVVDPEDSKKKSQKLVNY